MRKGTYETSIRSCWLISENLYQRVRSTGGSPPGFMGWRNLHKVNNPLRPVLSLPGSSYYNLNKVLAKFFEKIEGANIETNSLDSREILESTSNEPNENLISLDVKSLYTNVPLREAVDKALRKLYSQRPQDAALRNATRTGRGLEMCAFMKKKKKEHLNYYTIKSRGISVAKCK